MRDILVYAPILITLIVGMLGVFFGKTGERNKLAPISFVFLGLMVAAAAYGVYDLRAKAQERAAAAVAAEAREAALEDEVAASRRVLELDSFELTRPFEYGILYIDIGLSPDGPIQHPGFIGPFPTFGRAMRGEIHFSIDDVFSYHYDVRAAEDRAVTLARDGAAPVTLKADRLYCYQDAAGDCVNEGATPANGDWWAELIAPDYTHGVMLGTRASLNKLVARTLGEQTYGRMTFRVPGLTEAEHAAAAKGFQAMRPDMKVYAPLRAETADCRSAIHLPAGFLVAPRRAAAPEEIVVDIVPGKGRFSTVECEESPI